MKNQIIEKLTDTGEVWKLWDKEVKALREMAAEDGYNSTHEPSWMEVDGDIEIGDTYIEFTAEITRVGDDIEITELNITEIHEN